MSTTAHRLSIRCALGAGLVALGLLCASAAASATPSRSGAAHGRATTAQKHKQGPQKQHKPGAAQKRTPAGGAAGAGAPRSVGPGSGAAPRSTSGASGGAPLELALPIQRTALDNGLRVVLSADPSSPTVAVAVTYDAGSRNEVAGRSGVARILERLMFQGSTNVASGEHLRLVTERGGALDSAASVASTASTTDCTRFAEVVPASELALALWLEADRLRAPELSAQAFEVERRAAREERASRLGAAYGRSSVRLAALVFQGYWPYEHEMLGSAEDLDGAEVGWVRDFRAAHYGPNNAVLSIAGGFDPDEALRLVRKYFGGIPKLAAAPFADVPFPEQTSQRTAVVRDAGARAPGILYGWAVPPLGHPDHYALELAAIVLGRGESSRLHHLLVRDKATAQSLRVFTAGRRGPDLFSIDARLTGGARVGDVEKLIEGEIKALGTAGPSPAELTKAHRLAQAELTLRLEGTAARATALGEHEILFGDATHLSGELPHYLAVTREDVQRAVRDHLGPTRRTLIETYPPTAAEPAPTPRAPAQARPVSNAPAASGKKAAAKAAAGKRATKAGHAAAAHPPAKKKAATKPKKK